MQPFIIVRISDGASLPWCLSPLLHFSFKGSKTRIYVV
jgi:hypothetical protein